MFSCVPIDKHFQINKEQDLVNPEHHWQRVTIHNLYVTGTRKVLYRDNYKPGFWFYLRKLLPDPKHYEIRKDFKERLIIIKETFRVHGIPWPHLWPRDKRQVVEYAATATCDKEFYPYFDWDDFQDMLAYDIYTEIKSRKK